MVEGLEMGTIVLNFAAFRAIVEGYLLFRDQRKKALRPIMKAPN
jgi:hypothetical protein